MADQATRYTEVRVIDGEVVTTETTVASGRHGGLVKRVRVIPNAPTTDTPRAAPLVIAAGETFIVPAGQQILYKIPIRVEPGANLVIDGMLVQV